VHGKKIFKVHVGKKESGDVVGFFSIVAHIAIIVAQVSVPIYSDKDFCCSILLSYFPIFLYHRRILPAIRRPGDKMQWNIFLFQIPGKLLDICFLGSSLTHNDNVLISYVHQ
jgi:hypothetical protein